MTPLGYSKRRAGGGLGEAPPADPAVQTQGVVLPVGPPPRPDLGGFLT
jgi:hypothetical protein